MSQDEIPEVKLPPLKPFKLSSWLISALVTTAVVAGALGGLAVLLFGDAFFGPSDDPAIPSPQVTQVQQQVSAIDARMNSLEQKAQNTTDVTQLQSDLQKNAERTAALQQKVETINTAKTQDTKGNAILLGLTQLKTAYDYNLPLEPGIKTLSDAIDDQDTKKTLADLAEVAGKGLPSNETLLKLLGEATVTQAQPVPLPPNATWQQRAKHAMGQFVTVKPASSVNEQNTIHNIRQAIMVNDLATASAMIQTMPESPASKILLSQIKIRLQAQQLMYDVVNKVTRFATLQKGGLY